MLGWEVYSRTTTKTTTRRLHKTRRRDGVHSIYYYSLWPSLALTPSLPPLPTVCIIYKTNANICLVRVVVK